MIIGITGVKGSGKNTVADMIEANFSDMLNVNQLAFANKLKESAAACFGIPKEEAIEWCDYVKRCGSEINVIMEGYEWGALSGREFLQNYGAEAHRDVFGKDFWVNALLDSLVGYTNQESHLDIITDVRFANEAETIRSYEGKIIQVRRYEAEISEDKHPSEKLLPLDLTDGVIYNNGSLEMLEVAAVQIVNAFIGKDRVYVRN